MPRANVRVRPATVDDIDGLVALLGSVDLSRGTFSGRSAPRMSEAQMRERLADVVVAQSEECRRLTVAADESSGEILGLLVTRRDEVGALNLTPVLNVTHLLVSPRSRRRGVGRALLNSAVHVAEHGDCTHVVATVSTNSRGGNRYLSRLGFAPLVTHRIASVSALRKSLGMTEPADGLAAVRRGRLLRAQRAGGLGPRRTRRVARGA